jgi:hypothetical protein
MLRDKGREREQNLGPGGLLAGVTFPASLAIREGNMIKNRMVIIAGATALVLAAGGGAAYAASASIPDSSGVIHGCYKPTSNGGVSALGVIDTALPGGTCPKGQTALSWNQTGPQGPAGPAGPQGPAGPSTAGQSGLDVIVVQGQSDGSGRAMATCPSDHPYVLGGGSSQGSGSIAAEFPFMGNGNGQGEEPSSGNGWEAQTSTFPNGPTIGVYAMCAK